MPVNAELLARLLAPIPGDPPTGKDLRYAPSYAAVKEARREDPDLPPGELDGPRKLADWQQTVTLATQLLEHETKDLQLAAWLTEALLRKEGFGGLATGLALLDGLLGSFWEHVYPLLEDDDLELRSGPIEWVGSRLDVAVRQTPIASGGINSLDFAVSRGIPSESDTEGNNDKRAARAEALAAGKRSPEDVDSAVEASSKPFFRAVLADLDASLAAVVALETSSDARFGRDAPGFTVLRRALEEVRATVGGILARRLEIDPDPVDEVGDAAADGALGGGDAGDGTISSEVTSARDAAARIAAAAKFLRQTDPTSPAPYLLLRGFRWGELRATPGDLDPRLLEAPPTAARSRLKGLLLDARWQELLEQGEALMATPQGRGWLDLQRYTLTACAHLGESYDGVAAVVRSELRSLLAALPQLPQMTLMDDTPTANGETREWLASEGITAEAAAEAAAAAAETHDDAHRSDEGAGEQEDSPTDDGTDALEDALDEEEATASNGGFAKAPLRRSRGRAASADPFTTARNELALGRPNRAIELMVAQHSRERSPRGRFVRQTQVAYLMVEAGLEAVARPMLERLVQIIDERSLEDWETGPLVAQPMALLCRVYDALQVREDDRDELYLRVCRLDPLQALGLRRS
jgi:type VI secretion system protein ImpA